MRSDRERLLDIAEAIDRVIKYAHRGREDFKNQELIQTWVIHHIEIIGEAARRISPALQEAHPEVPWEQIVAMRNVIAHDYFGIDVERVWNVVEGDIPILRGQVQDLLDQLPDS